MQSIVRLEKLAIAEQRASTSAKGSSASQWLQAAARHGFKVHPNCLACCTTGESCRRCLGLQAPLVGHPWLQGTLVMTRQPHQLHQLHPLHQLHLLHQLHPCTLRCREGKGVAARHGAVHGSCPPAADHSEPERPHGGRAVGRVGQGVHADHAVSACCDLARAGADQPGAGRRSPASHLRWLPTLWRRHLSSNSATPLTECLLRDSRATGAGPTTAGAQQAANGCGTLHLLQGGVFHHSLLQTDDHQPRDWAGGQQVAGGPALLLVPNLLGEGSVRAATGCGRQSLMSVAHTSGCAQRPPRLQIEHPPDGHERQVVDAIQLRESQRRFWIGCYDAYEAAISRLMAERPVILARLRVCYAACCVAVLAAACRMARRGR